MNVINLIAKNLPLCDPDGKQIPSDWEEQVCCVTGERTKCFRRKELFGSSFCDGNRLAAPTSNWVGENAFRVLSHKYERMSLWLATSEEFKRIFRTDVRSIVFNGVDSEYWSCYVTTSYKKHGAIGNILNRKGSGFVRFENENVDCRDLDKNNSWFDKMKEFQLQGVFRSMFETCDIGAACIRKIGIDVCREFEEFARPKWRSSLWRLLCYLLPSKEELKGSEQGKVVRKQEKPEQTKQVGTMSLF